MIKFPLHSHAPKPERTTDLLLRMVTEDGNPRLTINGLIEGLGDRAFGLIMLLVALPNCVPNLPGIGSLLGLPLVLFSLQLMLGQHKPWLPSFLGQREFSKTDFRRVIVRTAPYVRKFEAVCRPRLRYLTEGVLLRLLGFLVFILSLLIVAPFPGTNFLPAIAIAVISIGLIERDGLIVSISVMCGLGAVYVSGAFAYVGTKWVIHKLIQFFST